MYFINKRLFSYLFLFIYFMFIIFLYSPLKCFILYSPFKSLEFNVSFLPLYALCTYLN